MRSLKIDFFLDQSSFNWILFRHIGKTSNNIGRAPELAADIGTAAASKNPKLIAASAINVVEFVHQGKVFI